MAGSWHSGNNWAAGNSWQQGQSWQDGNSWFGQDSEGDVGFTFDNAEAVTLVTAMSVEPDDTRKGLIDDLIGSLKTAGIWTKLDALWVIAAHDAQAARLNWKAPGTSNLTVGGGAPTFLTDRHYATDGIDDWLDTNYNPVAFGGVYAQNDACFFVWNRLDGQSGSACAGWFDGTDGVSINPRTTGEVFAGRINNAASFNTANDVAVGLFSVNRTGILTHHNYKNGAQSGGNGTETSAAINSANLKIGGATATGFSAKQFAIVGVGQGTTPAQQASLYTALNTYMTAVGAA